MQFGIGIEGIQCLQEIECNAERIQLSLKSTLNHIFTLWKIETEPCADAFISYKLVVSFPSLKMTRPLPAENYKLIASEIVGTLRQNREWLQPLQEFKTGHQLEMTKSIASL